MATKWALAPSVVRTARKDHFCDTQRRHDRAVRDKWDEGHVPAPCPFGGVIRRGQTYIEYLGETPAWQSGIRYHVGCAGLYDERPTWHRAGCSLTFREREFVDPRSCVCGGEPAPYEPVEIPA